jgi:hypothetical protein
MSTQVTLQAMSSSQKQLQATIYVEFKKTILEPFLALDEIVVQVA